MIVEKTWTKKGSYGVILTECRGWFLFGIIPLYIRVDERR